MYIKKSNQCKFNCLELCTDIASFLLRWGKNYCLVNFEQWKLLEMKENEHFVKDDEGDQGNTLKILFFTIRTEVFLSP